jgi:hypothetical protein
MATTTNYSWTTPDDTALVKDGAAAIRTLGSSADTTVKNLNPETTLGDIAYRSSTANVKTRLGLGTAGQVLTVNSGATAPEWKDLAAGSLTLLATANLSAATTVSFTSIPTTYKNLRLIFSNIWMSAYYEYMTMRLNNDSTAGNYKWRVNWLQATTFGDGYSGTTATAFGSNNQNSPIHMSRGDDYPPLYGIGVIDIFNANSTTQTKQVQWESSAYKSDIGQSSINFGNGFYDSTTAISRIDFLRSSTQTINGKIELWGVN